MIENIFKQRRIYTVPTVRIQYDQTDFENVLKRLKRFKIIWKRLNVSVTIAQLRRSVATEPRPHAKSVHNDRIIFRVR